MIEQEKLSLNNFSMLSLLGFGNYAKVILVRKINEGRTYAMKIVKKKKEQQEIKGLKKSHAYIERQILIECRHPFIVHLNATFQRKRKLYFVLQYCPGGQIFGLIKRHKRLNEEVVKFYVAQVILALECLHVKNYIYRDLKPENILIDRKGYIKIVDFGLSCRQNDPRADSIAGTPEYLPPQSFIKGNKISKSADWWALGNLIFQMIAGFPPFFDQQQNLNLIKEKICNQQPPLHLVSNIHLKDLLTKLLQKNPEKRLGYQGSFQIKQHPWFYGVPWQELLQKRLEAPFIPEIKSDDDTHWFQLQEKPLTPPEEQIQKSSVQKYNSFSLSWKSNRSNDVENSSQGELSPPEIVLNIENYKQNQQK